MGDTEREQGIRDIGWDSKRRGHSAGTVRQAELRAKGVMETRGLPGRRRLWVSSQGRECECRHVANHDIEVLGASADVDSTWEAGCGMDTACVCGTQAEGGCQGVQPICSHRDPITGIPSL